MSDIKDLIVSYEKFSHSTMLSDIRKCLPEIKRSTSYFGKTQSQFMDNMLTVSHPTPLRNVRQILAQIEKTMNALRENYFKNEKLKKELEIKKRDLSKLTGLELELAQIDIDDKISQLEHGELYFSGAIRQVKSYTEQYESILKKYGKEKFTEEDFEKEEEEYHIKKAFDQALCAARAHAGMVDEGNHIYFSQIGVNGGQAQKFITDFLNAENKEIELGHKLSPRVKTNFLNDMYNYFKGCSDVVVEEKGMNKLCSSALLVEGDTRSTLKLIE